METVRIEFEPYINGDARQFIVNAIDYLISRLPDCPTIFR
jgi:hypothetical protein